LVLFLLEEVLVELRCETWSLKIFYVLIQYFWESLGIFRINHFLLLFLYILQILLSHHSNVFLFGYLATEADNKGLESADTAL